MSDEENIIKVDSKKIQPKSCDRAILVPLCLKWAGRLITLVFICFLVAYLNSSETNVIYLISKLLPLSFYILFSFQMGYYFVWYRFEMEQKISKTNAISMAYGKLKTEYKYFVVVHGGILISLYITKVLFLKG